MARSVCHESAQQQASSLPSTPAHVHGVRCAMRRPGGGARMCVGENTRVLRRGGDLGVVFVRRRAASRTWYGEEGQGQGRFSTEQVLGVAVAEGWRAVRRGRWRGL